MANQSKDEGLSSTDQQRPLQSQPRQPGRQNEMVPQPRSIPQGYQGSGKLAGKVAIITFLASDDASYMTGQVLHPNGGEIING